MNDNSSYNQAQGQNPAGMQGFGPGQQGPMQPPMQGQRQQHPLANYQFSSEEMRVLRECNTESFFQRCIPISAMLGFGTHFAVKNGILGSNPKYGSIPKVVVSVIVGYFLGKVSYQQRCAEKMMQLPNSKLGEVLRQRKEGGITGALGQSQGIGTPGFGLTPFSTQSTTDEAYDDTQFREPGLKVSSLDLDTERPSYGLDESHSFGDIGSQTDSLPLEPPKKTVSYEELRKANRDAYYKSMQSGVPSVQNTPTVVRVKEPNRTEDSEQMKNMPKNQYGDVWSN